MIIAKRLAVLALATSMMTTPSLAADYHSGAQLGLQLTDAQAHFKAEEEAIARRPYQRMRTRYNRRLDHTSNGEGRYVRQHEDAYAAGNVAEQPHCDRSCRRARVGVAIIGGIAGGIGGALGRGLANRLF